MHDPGAFGVEHNDAMAVRDLGWLLYWVATAQEALDMALMAWKIAENDQCFLPFALSCDGSFLTHSQAMPHVHAHRPLQKHVLVCGNVDCATRGSVSPRAIRIWS